jgi:hypothetical protein
VPAPITYRDTFVPGATRQLLKALERLIELDGARVWAGIIRAKDQRGAAVVRSGTLQVLLSPGDMHLMAEGARGEPIAHVVDADDLPLVTLLGSDAYSVWNALVSAEFRSSFRVDILDRPFPQPALARDVPLTFERAARDLAAELEAGFRGVFLVRPDPDADATTVPARFGALPVTTGPLSDGSVRFAVGHAAATLLPDADAGIRLKCIASELRFGRQYTHLLVPARGNTYALEPAEIERLGSDIRAFLSNRRERFVLQTEP